MIYAILAIVLGGVVLYMIMTSIAVSLEAERNLQSIIVVAFALEEYVNINDSLPSSSKELIESYDPSGRIALAESLKYVAINYEYKMQNIVKREDINIYIKPHKPVYNSYATYIDMLYKKIETNNKIRKGG